MPLLFVGIVMCMFGYLGAFQRYVAGESAPVAKDVVNDMGENIQPAVKGPSRRGMGVEDVSCSTAPAFWPFPRIPGGNAVRHMPDYTLRGALSGLLCCSPGLLMGLWAPADGAFLWALLFSWWAPGVSYGVLITVPLAIALKRSPAAVAVAFLASPGGYFVALWLPNSGVFGMPEAHPWLRDYIPGAVGAAILAAGTLPWRGAAVRAALLTVIAGAIASLAFEVDLFPGKGMVQCIVGFVVWQSATAACLSLGLVGRPSDGPSKSVLPSDGDNVYCA